MKATTRIKETIEKVKEITGGELAFCDKQDKITSTCDVSMDELQNEYAAFDVVVADEVCGELFVLRTVENIELAGKLAAISVGEALSDGYVVDKAAFYKMLLAGELSDSEVQRYAARLHVTDGLRVCYCIDFGGHTDREDSVISTLKNFYRSGIETITSYDKAQLLVLINYKALPDASELLEIALAIADVLGIEALVNAKVGISDCKQKTSELADAAREAAMACRVGKLFYPDETAFAYGSLGIGRLIDGLSKETCERFLMETLGTSRPEIMADEQSLQVINAFFDNNLNIAETARALYMHRNTLVYRLDRIAEAQGLDIRRFEDALNFKIAYMVYLHLSADGAEGGGQID